MQSAVSNQVFTSLQYKNYCTTGASATPTDAQESRTAPQTENKDSQNEPPLSAEAKELEELKASHEKLSKEKEEAEVSISSDDGCTPKPGETRIICCADYLYFL